MSEPKSNASRVYATLRMAIIRCELAPNQRLKIAEIASELDVSPGAVREALSRLSSEQLVIAEDQRGFRTAPITDADLTDLTEARIQIECLMIALAMAAANDQTRTELRRAERALAGFAGVAGSPEAARLHAAFHDQVVSACGNRTLLGVRQSLYERSQRYRYLAMRATSLRRDVIDEHRRIADAIIAGDVEEAVAAMTDHIRRTADIVREALGLDRPPLAAGLKGLRNRSAFAGASDGVGGWPHAPLPRRATS